MGGFLTQGVPGSVKKYAMVNFEYKFKVPNDASLTQ